MPLVAYPISAPRDDENAQRLCMSGANAGLSILFFAMHASIVTSAMATAVEIPTKQTTAEVTDSPTPMARIAVENIPSIPTTTKRSGFFNHVYNCGLVANINDEHIIGICVVCKRHNGGYWTAIASKSIEMLGYFYAI